LRIRNTGRKKEWGIITGGRTNRTQTSKGRPGVKLGIETKTKKRNKMGSLDKKSASEKKERGGKGGKRQGKKGNVYLTLWPLPVSWVRTTGLVNTK